MKHLFFLTSLLTALCIAPAIEAKTNDQNSAIETDLMEDTWVATDALGRVMPTSDEAPLKTDRKRTVGIFYITWHGDENINQKAPFDVTKILEANPEARFDADSKFWPAQMYHWGEPEVGYFLSRDEYVIRKDMSMLADAGVDMIILDVTNGVLYWKEWEVLFNTMEQMRAEGNKVPQFCFWTFNNNPVRCVKQLYEKIYKAGKYSDMWFYWDGKPLMLYNARPNADANGTGYDAGDYGDEIRNYFTLRNMWWGYYEWQGERYTGTEDNWCFGYELGDEKMKALTPQQLAATHNGRPEEMAVTPAQHPISNTGKSWRRETGEPKLDQYDLPEKAYVPWLGETVDNPEAYGIYFQDRFDEALQVDPDFIYLNDWNEWTAGKYKSGFAPGSTTVKGPDGFIGRDNPFYFVDQYNSEFNRAIQPMKDGYTDNYYMQMVQNLRRYKGVRPIPQNKGQRKIVIDGRFDDWKKVKVTYRDTKGDVAHRDHPGYGGIHYVNNSGRNDIVLGKVAVTADKVCFYAETAQPLTPSTDPRWMLLFIDADCNASTGWAGYEYMVNYEINGSQSTILRYDAQAGAWRPVGVAELAYDGNALELAIDRSLLGVDGKTASFDFKWSDNPQSLADAISLCIDGDTAPNRRFNYRFLWKK